MVCNELRISMVMLIIIIKNFETNFKFHCKPYVMMLCQSRTNLSAKIVRLLTLGAQGPPWQAPKRHASVASSSSVTQEEHFKPTLAQGCSETLAWQHLARSLCMRGSSPATKYNTETLLRYYYLGWNLRRILANHKALRREVPVSSCSLWR